RSRASAHGNMVTEDAVCRVQNGHRRAAASVRLGKIASDEARVLTIFARRDGDDEQIGIEGADMFDAEELEHQRAFGKIIECAEGGFGGDAKIAQWAGLPRRLSSEQRAIPLQRHLGGTL